MRPVTFVILIALALVVTVIIIIPRCSCPIQTQIDIERFESSERPLRVLHISPSVSISLVSDEVRGPTAAQLSATRLGELSRRGLRIVARDDNPDMSVVDSLTALKSDRIVVPLLSPEHIRSLTLFAPAEAPADLPAYIGSHALLAVCPGRLEADLFAIAWAAAGGSDNTAAAATFVGSYEDAAAASKNRQARIAVAWGCSGSRAVIEAETAAKMWSRIGKARSVAYGDRDGAQHQVAARAPSLRLSPSTVPGESAVLSAPSLIVMKVADRRFEDGAVEALAAEMTRLVLLGNERDGLARTAFTSATSRVPLATSTASALNRMSMHIKSLIDASLPYERATLPILEQFESSGIELIPASDVKGRFVPGEDAAVLASGKVDGVSLRRGDRLLLSNQTRSVEDGTYVVVNGGNRARITPRVTINPAQYRSSLAKDESGRWTWSFNFSAKGTDSDLVRIGESVVWGPTGSTGVLAAAGRVDVQDNAIHVDADTERLLHDWLHPLATCSADPRVPTRELCESKGGIWDHPCVQDDECPFFTPSSSKSGETTYRGGCMSGYCEMPIGVRRVPNSFRHANPHDMPICACSGSTSRAREASETCCSDRPVPLFELQNPV